jgi:transposase
LTKYKRKLIQNVTSEKQRIEKILEDANIKLASIASNTFGASGGRIIEELMKGKLKRRRNGRVKQGETEKKERRAQRGARGEDAGRSQVHDQGVPGTYKGN